VNHQGTKTQSFGSANHSADSILDQRHIEIDQQAEAFLGAFVSLWFPSSSGAA
jgi:hypothetical protein